MIAATAIHADLLAALHRDCFAVPQAWSASAFAVQLRLPGNFAWLLPQGLALARVVADEAELLTLGVLPDARGGGLGGTLLRASMMEAQRRGAAAMFLEVGRSNLAARRLYAGHGYARVGERRGYYADGEDALMLRARLSPCGSSAP